MANVLIKKINETWVEIFAESQVLFFLRKEFTFDVPNARFTPAYKKGWWNGSIELINKNGTTYVGLLQQIKDVCKDKKLSIELEGFTDEIEVNPKEIISEIESWNPKRYEGNNLVDLEPYTEQLKAIWLALSTKRCIIESATAAGKSFIIAALTRFLHLNRKILIIVPRVDLATQLKENFNEYFPNWNVGIDVLYSETELTGQDIVISTWQSIIKNSDEYFEEFDVVIEDEVHEGEAKTLKSIIEKCINADYRIGLSGSLKTSQTHTLTLNGLFGKNYKLSTASGNIKKGISAELDLRILKLNWKSVSIKYNDKIPKEKYDKECEYIIENEKRNQIINAIAHNMEGTGLVLFKNVSDGDAKFKLYSEKYPHITSFIIHSKVPKKRRDEIVNYIKQNPEEKIVLFASYGTFATGINIKSIREGILAFPIKGENVKLIQGIGRGLRKKKNNEKFIFWDLYDQVGKVSVLEKQAISRLKKYRSEGHNYTIISLDNLKSYFTK